MRPHHSPRTRNIIGTLVGWPASPMRLGGIILLAGTLSLIVSPHDAERGNAAADQMAPAAAKQPGRGNADARQDGDCRSVHDAAERQAP